LQKESCRKGLYSVLNLVNIALLQEVLQAGAGNNRELKTS